MRQVVAADHHTRRGAECGRAEALDLAAMLNCTEDGERPPAGHICNEWTRDWLHPFPFVYGAYFNMAANVLADLGEVCMASLQR